jgi:predicted nucleic acid-binding protein
LAECYATLSSLPLKRRISTAEALQLIEESILSRVQIVELGKKDYLKALARVQKNGLSSGAMYDTLHIIAAEKMNADRIYTFNLKHFSALATEPEKVRTP